jgi:hypothetical protein
MGNEGDPRFLFQVGPVVERVHVGADLTVVCRHLETTPIAANHVPPFLAADTGHAIDRPGEAGEDHDAANLLVLFEQGFEGLRFRARHLADDPLHPVDLARAAAARAIDLASL